MSSLSPSSRRIAKNSAAQLLSLIVAGGSKAIAAVMVARSLGPDGMGVFSLSWTLAGTLSFLAVFGLDYLLIRELARKGSRADLEEAFTLACLLGGVVAFALFAFTITIDPHGHITKALAGAAGYIAISAPVLILRAAFHARERMEYESYATGVEGVFAILGVGVALSMGAGVPGAIAGLTLGRIAALGVSLAFYRKLWGPLRPRWAPEKWRPLLKTSIPMAISYAFTAVYMRFDVVLLAALRPPEEVGLYGAVSVIILTVPILASSFSGSLYPVLSRVGRADDPEVERLFDASVRLLLVVSIPMMVGLMILAGPIMGLTYGSDFLAGERALLLLALVLPMRFVNNLIGHVLTAVDRQSKRTAAVVIAAVSNLGLNLVAIPIWGILGAVYSTLITEVILTFFLLGALKPLRIKMRGIAEGSLVAAFMGVVVVSVPGGVVGRLGAGAVAFAMAAVPLIIRNKTGASKDAGSEEPMTIVGRA